MAFLREFLRCFILHIHKSTLRVADCLVYLSTMKTAKHIEDTKRWREEHSEEIKAYRRKHYLKLYADPETREKMLARNREWKRLNRPKVTAATKRWIEKNPEAARVSRKKQYDKDREKHYAYTYAYSKRRRKEDVQYRLGIYLRTRLNTALRRQGGNGSGVRNLGCSVAELKARFETLFQSGMSWDNYGFYGWHIDHIRPLCTFDLTDPLQVAEACHYTNLQPLWAGENLRKSKSFTSNVSV